MPTFKTFRHTRVVTDSGQVDIITDVSQEPWLGTTLYHRRTIVRTGRIFIESDHAGSTDDWIIGDSAERAHNKIVKKVRAYAKAMIGNNASKVHEIEQALNANTD